MLAKLYSDHLKKTSLYLPIQKKNCNHVFHLYTVYHPKRDLIIRKLRKKNIQIKIYYPYPIHKMKAYKNNKINSYLPLTETMAKGIFSLPLYPNLDKKEVLKFINILKKILKNI